MLDKQSIHIQYLNQTQLIQALSVSQQQKTAPLMLLAHSHRPIVDLPLQPLIQLRSGLESITDRPYELWTATGQWHHASIQADAAMEIAFCRNEDFLVGSLSIKLPPGHELKRLSQLGYEQIIHCIGQQGRPHLLRMWNYFPDINHMDNDLERYQSFCIGRHQAFVHSALTELQYPAASAVGSHGQSMVIIFMATKTAGLFLENPDQVSAYHYPSNYSPESPSFARGAVYQDIDRSQLYISGTASIVGHASQFQNDINGQTLQTIKNIQRLIEHTNSQQGVAGQFAVQPDAPAIKVYLRNPDDQAVVAPIIEQNLSHSDNICYLHADICRQELDIEIEMLLEALQPQANYHDI